MHDLTALLKRCASTPPNILSTLQAVQHELGYVPTDAVPKISAALGVTDSDVAGVLSFYHDLRTDPPGRHVIRFCLGESCLATHCEKSLSALERATGCKLGETSKDGRFTLEKVYCLGNCALSPSMLVGEELHGRFTPETVAAPIKDLQ
jgi:NADH:ubiquinone oxidoreductase subunit E